MTYPLTTALLAAEAALPARDHLSADEVASWFCVDRKTVCGAAARGDIPHQRVGKRIRFSRTVLAAWLAAPNTSAHGATQAASHGTPPTPAATQAAAPNAPPVPTLGDARTARSSASRVRLPAGQRLPAEATVRGVQPFQLQRVPAPPVPDRSRP